MKPHWIFYLGCAVIGGFIGWFVLGDWLRESPKMDTIKRSGSEVVITVSTAIVSKTVYGFYAPRSSAVFEINKAIEGYRIESTKGDETIMVVFCSRAELDNYISLVKYESLRKDSVAMVIPITK